MSGLFHRVLAQLSQGKKGGGMSVRITDPAHVALYDSVTGTQQRDGDTTDKEING